MGIFKVSLFPLVIGIITLYLWKTNKITGSTALYFELILTVFYSLIQCYRYGVFDRNAIVKLTFPGMKYYYKEYQCIYTDVKKKVMSELEPEDHNMLKSIGRVNYFAIYYDNPKMILEKQQGRACAGFALQGDAVEDIGINKVLQTAKFKEIKFIPCDGIAVKLPKIDEISNFLAIIKTMNKLWEIAGKSEKDPCSLFQWEEGKTVISGIFTGDSKNQYFLHSAEMPPSPRKNTGKEPNSPIGKSKKEK